MLVWTASHSLQLGWLQVVHRADVIVSCSKPSYQLLVANLGLKGAWLQVVHPCTPEIEGLIIHQLLEIIHGCQGLNIHLQRTFPSTRQILINIQNAALVMHPRNHDN